MDLFRAPRLNAHDYLRRITEAASGSFGKAAPTQLSAGNSGKFGPATKLKSKERPFFQNKGEPLSAEILYLKLHLLETLAAELLPQGERLAHPQISQTLDRVWLRANHQLSHVPYFWRFSLDWLEPATTPIPTDAPQSGMAYCLNALALIWQSVFEFDENQGRKKRKNSADEAGSPESEAGGPHRKTASTTGPPTSSWQKKIIQEAMQIGKGFSQAARGEIPADSSAFLDPIKRLKNRLWERIFNPAPPSAQPEAFPAELQAALHRIADRWEENLAEISFTPGATESVEESSPAEEESIQVDDDEDDEFITETIVMSAPEDTARLEMEGERQPAPEAASDESTPPPESEDSLAETVALRKDSGKPLDSEESLQEAAPEAPVPKEETLAETAILKDGKGTASDSQPTTPRSLDSPPQEEPDLAETVVLKNGGPPPPPRPPETPERQPDEESNLAETVALRTGGERRPESPPRSSETSAPPSDPEHDLAETVVLKNGGGHRPDSSPQQTETPGPPPDGEPGLAETVVLRGSDTGKNGPPHVPPPTNPPEPPDKETDDLAATVIVRPGKKTSAKPDQPDTEPTAPENETESSDSLTETVILRPGRNLGKERP
jgi:hypothetical protein